MKFRWRSCAGGDRYEVDEYSQVQVTSAADDVCDLSTKLKVKLPSVSSSSCIHHLVTVTGLHC